MKKFIRSALFTAFVGTGLVAFAQDTPPPARQPNPPNSAQQPDEGEPRTVTGCLMKGAGPNQYAITDNKSGEKLSFVAPDQLQTYLNQTVQLKGVVTNRGGSKIFHPESVSSVASTCQKAQ
jgi:hypothetical protein